MCAAHRYFQILLACDHLLYRTVFLVQVFYLLLEELNALGQVFVLVEQSRHFLLLGALVLSEKTYFLFELTHDIVLGRGQGLNLQTLD